MLGLVLKVLVATAIAYATALGTLWLLQDRILYPGAAGGALSSPSWGRLIHLKIPDGQTVAALHRPAQPGRPTVLFFPGNGDRIDRYAFLADRLQRSGSGLLALSYRGYPGSTGRPGEASLVADGIAAFDWLRAQTNAPIVLLGQSLGTAVAIRVAVERPGVAGLALLSPFDSIEAVAAKRFWFFPVRLLLRDGWRSADFIAQVAQLKLFVHGRRDSLVPLFHAERLYQAATDPKRMIVYDDAGHNDLWRSELIDEIEGFLRQMERPSGG